MHAHVLIINVNFSFKLEILQERAAPAVKLKLYENTEVRYNNACLKQFALDAMITVPGTALLYSV